MEKNRKAGVFESVEELIGCTPLVKLRASLSNVPAGAWLKKNHSVTLTERIKSELYAKLEFQNPGGSVKDRIARKIVRNAEKNGQLKPGATIIEATSGNTGAGLAVMAALCGYKCIFVMPDKMSAEKVNSLRAFGAKVVVSPSQAGPDQPGYYVNVSKRLAKEIPNSFLANQYFNPDNPAAHFESTGPEIWEQMDGKIDAFIAGIGTGGTLSGTARYLKSKNPKIKTVAVDPSGSIYTGLINEKKPSPVKKYLVEGIGEDMVPGTIDLSMIDDVVTVDDGESFAATRMLAQREALLTGGSCGSAFMGAVQWLAAYELKNEKPLRAVVLLPDSGSRYLSKIFNTVWLDDHSVNHGWGSTSLGGEVEYLADTKKIPGV